MLVHEGHADLRSAWAALRRRHPTVGRREAAAALAVSEGELVAAGAGESATRLVPEWARVLADVAALGPVVCVTRAPRAISRVRAAYGTVHVAGAAATVLHRALELRAHLEHWVALFAVDDGRVQSLQVFDADGTAVHAMHLDAGSDRARYRALVARWASADQSPRFALRAPAPPPCLVPEAGVDEAGLRAAWGALRDTQEVGYLLRRFGVSRRQAIQAVAPDFAQRVSRRAVRDALAGVVATGVPVTITIANAGTVQGHAGSLKRVSTAGRWLVVRSYGFQLDLRADRVAEAWVVRKPTVDGTVTSLDLFDAAGEPIATIGPARKAGFQESPAWRTVLARLPLVVDAVRVA